MAYDLETVRAGFPILQRRVDGRPLVYLDSAATSLMPRVVVDAVADFCSFQPGSVHRSAHSLGEQATTSFEQARWTAQRFLNAQHPHEIVFIRGATHGLNMLARGLGELLLGPGDEVVVSSMEHHANLIPWQQACARHRAELRVARIDARGDLDLDALGELLGARTRVVALTHVSNVLGTVNPVAEVAALARDVGAVTVVDGAQAVGHVEVDVAALGCDFYVCSGHKMLGPTGVGLMYGRSAQLARLPAVETGGGMVDEVSWTQARYVAPPQRFEAGTPPVAQAVGLAAAIACLEQWGVAAIAAHQADVMAYAVERLSDFPGVTLVGQPRQRAAALSFRLDRVHALDVAALLDHQGIAVRAGTHCAQPLMACLGVDSTVRVSLGVYSGRRDIDALVEALGHVAEFS